MNYFCIYRRLNAFTTEIAMMMIIQEVCCNEIFTKAKIPSAAIHATPSMNNSVIS